MGVAGIDVSSFHVDVVLLDDDSDDARWSRIGLVGLNPFERARSMRLRFPPRSFWEDAGVYLIGIEDPHSRANHTAKALGLATGAVAVMLPSQLTIVQTAPAEWKRIFTGRAGASKDEIREAAEKRGFRAPEQDAHDAYGIAWAVRALNTAAIRRGAA